jgi:EAL domain-containing protein (putative c-di-GMP-specific phosphodiesterase class I)
MFRNNASLDGVDTVRSGKVLCGIARLATGLGLEVLVEGIETLEHLELVKTCNEITEGQGFLFSHPLPAEQIRDLLSSSDVIDAPQFGHVESPA